MLLLPFLLSAGYSIPLVVSTCPPGYINQDNFQKCYKFISPPSPPLTYFQAEFDCTKDGADLVTIENAFENQWIYQSLSYTKKQFYIGYTRLVNGNGTFVWMNHYNATYTNWCAPVPNNSDSAYIDMASGACWQADMGLSSPKYYICSKGEDPTVPMATTTSSSPKHCDPGWAYLDRSHSCYKIFNSTIFRNFSQAVQSCQQNGAQLASIGSELENDFISELLQMGERSGGAVWIGLTREMRQWIWTDGAPFGYSNWGEERPRPEPSNECVSIFQERRQNQDNWRTRWDNIPCSATNRRFACKKAANKQ